MMFTRAAVLTASIFFAASAWSGDYTNHPKAEQFISNMVKKHGFDKQKLINILGQAEKKQSILDAMARPAEKTKPWYEYRKIFLGKDRIEQGVDFWHENVEALDSVSKKYGVEPEIIVAIIGVETRYGRYMGEHRVLDALTTLGFDYPPRGKFFTSQLEEFFVLTEKHNLNPTKLLGSYAGAMGLGQFIPSSYLHYALDHTGDGFADIWSNKADAIASVGNYFKAHGWQSGNPVFASLIASKNLNSAQVNTGKRPSESLKYWRSMGFTVKEDLAVDTKAVVLKYDLEKAPEYLFGLHNFYVITRYNRSHMYVRAVWDLSQEIKSNYSAVRAPADK